MNTIEFKLHTCATTGCGVTYGLTAGFEERRRADHESFYCPNGHSHSYTQKTEAEKLRDSLRVADATIGRLGRELTEAKRPKRKPRAKKKAS